MNKTFKKIISVMLVLLMLLPMSISVFALRIITPEETQKALLDGINYKEIISVEHEMNFYHTETGMCFMDIVLKMPDDTYAKYSGCGEIYQDGVTCSRSVALNTTPSGQKIPLEKPVTSDEAVLYACQAFCISPESITLLTADEYYNYDLTHNIEVHNYNIEFSVGFGRKYRCTVEYDELSVNNMSLWKPNSIEGKIGLFFTVLIAKIKALFTF